MHSVSTNRPHSPDSRAHGPSRAPLTFPQCIRLRSQHGHHLWRALAARDLGRATSAHGVACERLDLLGGRIRVSLVGLGRFFALCVPTRRAATAGAHLRACRGFWGARVAPMCEHAANPNLWFVISPRLDFGHVLTAALRAQPSGVWKTLSHTSLSRR